MGTTTIVRTLNNRYELRELIGRGGMAEVHRAYDRHLDREVAIKTMHAAILGDVDHQRFSIEMRLLARLNHAHLVTLFDAGFDDDGARPWLAMELVDGPSLARRLSDGAMDPDDVARIGAGLAAALAHVHANGIVHRDVKPANVLLAPDGQPKLADFGIARAIHERSDLTGAGWTIGTASYLSPEQVKGAPVTGASDVYALGLVLLEALTGLRAYDGTAPEAAMARLHHQPLIPVSLGALWIQLLDAMTAIDPLERPTADAVASKLIGIGGGAPVGAPLLLDAPTAALSVASPSAIPPDRPRWHRRAALAAAAVAVLVLISAGAGEIFDGSSPQQPTAAAETPSASASTKDPDLAKGVAPVQQPVTQHQPRVYPHKKAHHHKAHGKKHGKKSGHHKRK
ncbi:serine/threonine protein kinase [Nocardioides humilatus]|uniref:non-specific serine/threonine protein kinase n=1 Tax=Nocardioides humilatus TaxID=2607660 RepID=A0A5B1L7H8_9ACTN|nr:serine/threonine-protein kinase [Nocardioides humilatus]KAA1416434.1 serine/threonine protein kinase [Nocardioides humilatus]